jgi:cytochrome c oxidase cbb3-type subunit 3
MDAASLREGERLFAVHCAFCHGPHGEGAKGPTLAQPALPRAGDDASLLRIIREGIGGTEMPRARLERPETLVVAAYVRSLGARPIEQVSGDPQHGMELYATKGACAQCHTIRGYGGAVGPDLSDIGRRRPAAYLRRALLQPGAEVPQSFSAYRQDTGLPENFLYVRVVTPNGEEFAGARVNEDTFSIQIRDLRGQLHSFFKSELAELHKDYGVSPMPSYAVLSKNEVDDLVAYLVSLRADK